MIAATTEASGLIATLKSRFTRFELSPPSFEEQYNLIRSIINKVDAPSLLKEDILTDIINGAEGNVRSLVLLSEQYIGGVYSKTSSIEESGSLVDAIFRNRCTSLEDMLVAASGIEDYQRCIMGLLSYASKAMARQQKDTVFIKICISVIKTFGSGLQGSLPLRYLFTAKLAELYYAIHFG